jgi:hypothetical protein
MQDLRHAKPQARHRLRRSLLQQADRYYQRHTPLK